MIRSAWTHPSIGNLPGHHLSRVRAVGNGFALIWLAFSSAGVHFPLLGGEGWDKVEPFAYCIVTA